MIQKWVIQMAISFIMGKLGKWGMGIDWSLVKVDAEAFIRSIKWLSWVHDEAVQVVFAIIDVAADVLKATEDLEKIVKLVVDGKIDEAWAALRDLILGSWQPSSAVEVKAYECVKSCESL